MKKASLLAPYRRLLVLCGLSLLLHLAVIAWLVRHASPPSHRAAPQPALSVRLQAPARSAPPAPAVHAVAAQAPALTPIPQPAPPVTAPLAVSAAVVVAARPPSPPAPEQDDPDTGPGRYRVRMPPSAELTYALSSSVAGQPAQAGGTARLIWKNAGSSYQLQIDGVTGHLTSAGVADDSGVRPLDASELRPDGSTRLTRFDPDSGYITFSASNRSYRTPGGSQDRASLLMQLAGIGLERPDQVKDVIAVYVAGADDARAVRYQVMGQEQLETTLGTLATWHLVQLVHAGETRLELWLAPAHQWLPVQLRATAPDGTVSIQTVTHIDIEAPPHE
ncbi:MAG TPA: DUF3108 domain-containing protein [Telluria sp.]|nr:DUF3108 domain-containing protein [Telluria sp.]